MYVRQPSRNIKIPENYHGNAFSPQPISRVMPPPLRQSVQERQPTGALSPIGDLSQIGDLPPGERIRDNDYPTNPEDFTEYADQQKLTESDDLRDIGSENTSFEASLERTERPSPTPYLQKPSEGTKSLEKSDSKRVGSLFQTLLPPVGRLEEHFPFGHGIRSEELLIMAMMLLVYLSGEEGQKSDNELLLLLGLLLFAG